MKSYEVRVRKSYEGVICINADTRREAIAKAYDELENDPESSEFDWTCLNEKWTAIFLEEER